MPLNLCAEGQNVLDARQGEVAALAIHILVETARLLGAFELLTINSAHIDGCLYHGDSETLFAEQLVQSGAGVLVKTSLNVGAVDLLHPGRERLEPRAREVAKRTMSAGSGGRPAKA